MKEKQTIIEMINQIFSSDNSTENLEKVREFCTELLSNNKETTGNSDKNCNSVPFTTDDAFGYLIDHICFDRLSCFHEIYDIKRVNGYQIFEIRSDLSIDGSCKMFKLSDKDFPSYHSCYDVDVDNKIFMKRLDAVEFATEYVSDICNDLVKNCANNDGLFSTSPGHVINAYHYDIIKSSEVKNRDLLRIYSKCDDIPDDIIKNTEYVLDINNAEFSIYDKELPSVSLVRRFLVCKQTSIPFDEYEIMLYDSKIGCCSSYDTFRLPLGFNTDDVYMNQILSNILSDITMGLNDFLKDMHLDLKDNVKFVYDQDEFIPPKSKIDELGALTKYGTILFHGETSGEQFLFVLIVPRKTES